MAACAAGSSLATLLANEAIRLCFDLVSQGSNSFARFIRIMVWKRCTHPATAPGQVALGG